MSYEYNCHVSNNNASLSCFGCHYCLIKILNKTNTISETSIDYQFFNFLALVKCTDNEVSDFKRT